MSPRIVVIYNEPNADRYTDLGEQKAVASVVVEAKGVQRALAGRRYCVEIVPLVPPLEKVRERLGELETDVVFNLFEGFEGRPETEAAVAEFLSELAIAYTGCPPAALSLALDKARTKSVLQKHDLPTPDFQVLTPETLSDFRLCYPCIVKPAAEDASHGLSEKSVVGDRARLEEQVKRVAEAYSGGVLVEEYIDGREFNITVMGNDSPMALPVSEIVYTLPPGKPRILTFSAKWKPHSRYSRSSNVVCPAQLDEGTRQSIAEDAMGAYEVIGCAGYARVDFRMGSDEVPQIIEVNPNPDLSPGAGVARQARAAGMSYRRLVERIVQLAQERRPVGN